MKTCEFGGNSIYKTISQWSLAIGLAIWSVQWAVADTVDNFHPGIDWKTPVISCGATDAERKQFPKAVDLCVSSGDIVWGETVEQEYKRVQEMWKIAEWLLPWYSSNANVVKKGGRNYFSLTHPTLETIFITRDWNSALIWTTFYLQINPYSFDNMKKKVGLK